MAKNLKNQGYDDFAKGLNLFTRDLLLKENESSIAYNVWATGKNSICKRPGIVKLCTIAGASKVDGLGTYYAGATRELIAMAGGVAYKVQTGTAVALSAAPASANVFTTQKRTDMCQAGGKLFFANGTESIRVYDGTAIRPQTGSIIAKYLIFYKGCLWAAGNPTAGNEARLYRSGTDVNIGNFTYQVNKIGTATATTANKLTDSAGAFTTANVTVGMNVTNTTTGTTAKITGIDSTTALSIDKDIFLSGNAYSIANNPMATSTYVSQSDGQYLNGFFKHQDFLYPVKERSLWKTSVGTDAYGLITNEMIDPARGCDSHFSIDTVDNDNFMFNEQGVFATGYEPNILDQIRTNIVSLRVDPKIKNIEKSRLDDVCAAYYDNHYYLSFTSGGGGYNDTILVYDRQRLGWWEFQYALAGVYGGANCFSEFKDSNGETKLYFGSAVDGSIYYFDPTIKQDAGYVINTQWKSGAMSFGDLQQEKFILDVSFLLGKQSCNPTINVYVDGELGGTKTISIGNTGSAGIGIDSIGVSKIGVEGGSLDIADLGGGQWVRIPIGRIGRNVSVEIIEEDSTGTKTWELNALNINYKPLNNLFQKSLL